MDNESTTSFEKIVRAILSKLDLPNCYITDKWLGRNFKLFPSEPMFEPSDASRGLANAQVCCFSNSDLKTTEEALKAGMEVRLSDNPKAGHGMKDVTVIALIGSLHFHRYIYVFQEKSNESIKFSMTGGKMEVSQSDLLKETEYEGGIYPPKKSVSIRQACEIRKIGLNTSADKKRLSQYAQDNELDEKQVLRVVLARSADQLLSALTMETNESGDPK